MLADFRKSVDVLNRWQNTPRALQALEDVRTVLSVLVDRLLPDATDEVRDELMTTYERLDEIEANLKERRRMTDHLLLENGDRMLLESGEPFELEGSQDEEGDDDG